MHSFPDTPYTTMPTFTITDSTGAAIRGGANREAGLAKLDNLGSDHSRKILEGLRTNLAGTDGLPKHGVLKLRNSSSTGSNMEFARMCGMDRWFSKSATFDNTAKALHKLLVGSGAKPETAEALLKQYCAKDGSIKCKDAITLINRVLPQSAQGATVADSLRQAGIDAPAEALQDSIAISGEENLEQGSFGKVFQATDHGAPCILKRFKKPIAIALDNSGNIARGAQMDANHLAAAKVPGTIAPNRYIIAKTEAGGGKSYHTVTAGRNFKEFCRANKAATLELHGLAMDKAKGARMDTVRSSGSEQKKIAQGFAAILMNASSHGVVFYDIKRENAFVDGEKLTLIDTDGAFKNSKTQGKNPENMEVTATFVFPTDKQGKDSPFQGLQQDLWSVGFTLLEHAGRGDGNLMDVGRLVGRDKYQFLVREKTPEEKFDWLQEKAGGPGRPGSVEDFALLCLKTALSKPDAAYFKRFTGEGSHLLDPILNHPLIGGRDQFIEKHLLKSAPAQEKLSDPLDNNGEVDSIDESEADIEEDKGLAKTIKDLWANKKRGGDDSEDDDSIGNKSFKGRNGLMEQMVLDALKNQRISHASDSASV